MPKKKPKRRLSTHAGTNGHPLRLRQLCHFTASRHDDGTASGLPVTHRLCKVVPTFQNRKLPASPKIGAYTVSEKAFQTRGDDDISFLDISSEGKMLIDPVLLNIAIEAFNADSEGLSVCTPIEFSTYHTEIKKGVLMELYQRKHIRYPEQFWQSHWRCIIPSMRDDEMLNTCVLSNTRWKDQWITEACCFYEDSAMQEMVLSVFKIMQTLYPPVTEPHCIKSGDMQLEQEDTQMTTGRLLGLLLGVNDAAAVKPDEARIFVHHLYGWVHNAVFHHDMENVHWIQCTNPGCQKDWWTIPRGAMDHWAKDAFVCSDMGSDCELSAPDDKENVPLGNLSALRATKDPNRPLPSFKVGGLQENAESLHCPVCSEPWDANKETMLNGFTGRPKRTANDVIKGGNHVGCHLWWANPLPKKAFVWSAMEIGNPPSIESHPKKRQITIPAYLTRTVLNVIKDNYTENTVLGNVHKSLDDHDTFEAWLHDLFAKVRVCKYDVGYLVLSSHSPLTFCVCSNLQRQAKRARAPANDCCFE